MRGGRGRRSGVGASEPMRQMRMRPTFSGNRWRDRNARERWKALGNGCAMGRKTKWVPAIGPRTSGKGDKRGHKTEVRGAEEEIGREVQTRAG